MRTFHDPELGRLAELARELGATMALGSQTDVINGTRFSTPTDAQWSPLGWGPQTSGVPNVSPSLPPFLGGSTGGTNGGQMGLEGVGGYGTAGNNAYVTSIANQNPHHYAVSPTWWVVVFILVGLFVLKSVHWRDTILEGGSERAEAGPFREEAGEEVR